MAVCCQSSFLYRGGEEEEEAEEGEEGGEGEDDEEEVAVAVAVMVLGRAGGRAPWRRRVRQRCSVGSARRCARARGRPCTAVIVGTASDRRDGVRGGYISCAIMPAEGASEKSGRARRGRPKRTDLPSRRPPRAAGGRPSTRHGRTAPECPWPCRWLNT